jgi:hypothetical protein
MAIISTEVVPENNRDIEIKRICSDLELNTRVRVSLDCKYAAYRRAFEYYANKNFPLKKFAFRVISQFEIYISRKS